MGWRARSLAFGAGLFTFACSAAALAAPSDCIEDGGEVACTSRQPGAFSYGLCDEAAAYASRMAAWCMVHGGTWHGVYGNPPCEGATGEDTEDTLADNALKFGEIIRGAPCTIVDSGWGAVFDSYNCFRGATEYEDGIMTRDSRTFTVTCAGGTETIRAGKSRQLSCPTGYVPKGTPRGTSCVRPLEDCDDCGVGNPITPGSGVKTQKEVDYDGGLLRFVRHYHSFGFAEPMAAAGQHTEGRLGDAWRTNFDKRVIPVGGSSAVAAALTLPTGELQYFDASGAEVLNYRGTTARLVKTAAGYFLNGPEGTERYGLDGRLQVMTTASGEGLTLFYSDGTSGLGGGVFVDAAAKPTSTPLPANVLVRVTDSYGRSLAFAYDQTLRIALMTDPAGGVTRYEYDKNSNLRLVTFPDGAKRTYHYNEPLYLGGWTNAFHALTGVTDELGSRYATYKYGPDGRAVSTEHAGGVGLVQLLYGAGSTTVTDAMGKARALTFSAIGGLTRFKNISASGGGGYGAGIKDRALDAKGNVSEQVSFHGAKTCFVHDAARNLETVRVEGLDASVDCATVVGAGATLPAGARKHTTEWHPRWVAPVRVAGPRLVTTTVYNGDAVVGGGAATCAPVGAVVDEGGASGQPVGVACERSMQGTSDESGAAGLSAAAVGAARSYKFTYNARGQILTSDGPRTDVADVTTFAYYAESDVVAERRGQLQAVTNALGHVTTFTSYDAHGRPLTMGDENGVTTALVYDARGRVVSRTFGGAPTEYSYDAAGNLVRITLPDGSLRDLAYDAAHRLVEIMDGDGHRLVISYDAADHVIGTTVFDAANQVAMKEKREYDADGRFVKLLDASDKATLYGYDAAGNLTSMTDATGRTAAATYDHLSRLTEVLVAGASDAKRVYDGQDNLVTVTNARGLSTGQTYSPFGELVSAVSPDTGTSSMLYDAAGNLTQRTDAEGRVTKLEYDALNRLTKVIANDGSVAELGYDVGTNGVGRLTSVKDPSGTRNLSYYARGLLVREEREVTMPKGPVKTTTVYSYDAADRVVSMRYPSGMLVTYKRDALGRVAEVSAKIGSVVTPIATGVKYSAFGVLASATGAGGAALDWSWNQDARLASYASGTGTRTHTYDASGLLTAVAGPSGNVFSYAYDDRGRIKSGSGPGGAFAYTFDGASNLTKRDVAGKTTDLALSATSNRLASATGDGAATFAYDPSGNMTSDGKRQMSYDALGRLVEIKVGGAKVRHVVDIHGRRVGRVQEGS